ncbi:hypothetical protein [Methylomonas sp. CM2]|uniref:hypothetical protein n=1 Tax=Methylomonas sp. CM2 TaxID=3417647 RepID=UPI003CE9C446
MSTLRTLLFTGGVLLTAQVAQAREINVPVPMEYGLIRSVLVNQLYTGAGETARVWKDGKQCSFWICPSRKSAARTAWSKSKTTCRPRSAPRSATNA